MGEGLERHSMKKSPSQNVFVDQFNQTPNGKKLNITLKLPEGKRKRAVTLHLIWGDYHNLF